MSYYTYTQIYWDDSDRSLGELQAAEVLSAARHHLISIDWPLDALSDLESGLANGGKVDPGFNQLRSFQIVEMFRAISDSIPDVTFNVRGLGEEAFDVWVASLRNGDILQMHGPFDE